MIHRSPDDSSLPASQRNSRSLTGLELGAKLHAMRPSVKLVLISGYSEEVIRYEAQSPPNLTFLAKPFWTQALLDTIRHIYGSFM